ncbi:ABC transporter substrate-binding protein [Actinoplanes sp. NPDC051851]|uniref:ABC transporter substrate-binding protein n=1 Tax=Actinoplanes sp. NPDC051851 TaxID=3154753 RepID=UPI0034236743
MKSIRSLAVALGLAGVLTLSACSGGAAESPAGAGSASGPSLTMAVSPWIGYGPWYIAQEKGYFAEAGLNVTLQNFSDYSAELAAISSSKVDAVSFPVNGVLQNFADLPVTATLLLDSSTKADAILAKDAVASVADLRGRKVAVEKGTTSELLLSSALEKNGMTFADVTVVPTASDQVAGVLASGSVDAAVAYEPYVSTALKSDGVKELYTAQQSPGLISDALYLDKAYLAANPGAAAAMARVWEKAVAAYEADPAAGQKIIATAIGADPASLTAAFDGVQFYDLAANAEQLGDVFATETLPGIASTMKLAGMIDAVPDLTGAVDATGVATAAKSG